MIRKYAAIMAAVLFLAVFAWGILPSVGLAADGSASGGYLSSYDNADPRPSQVSWWSTLAYLVSLFAVFAFVVVMALFLWFTDKTLEWVFYDLILGWRK